MTKKDYELIASALQAAKRRSPTVSGLVMHEVIANQLAESLSQANPRFKADKFMKACGLTS